VLLGLLGSNVSCWAFKWQCVVLGVLGGNESCWSYFLIRYRGGFDAIPFIGAFAHAQSMSAYMQFLPCVLPA